MVADMALKLWLRGHLQWHGFPTEFHKNLPIGSEVDRGTDTHRRDSDLISLLFSFRKESMLEKERQTINLESEKEKSYLAASDA